MTLAEKIAAKQAAMIAKKDQLQALTNKAVALAEGESPDDADIASIEELSRGIDQDAKDIESFQKAETALARGALPAGGGSPAAASGAGAASTTPTQLAIVRAYPRYRPSVDLLVRSALAAFECHVTHEPIESIVARRWPQALDVQETSKLLAYGAIQKAAQNPAFTNVAGWAQELVRESYAAFMDLLYAESIVPQIPMARHEFGDSARIVIPTRETWDVNNLAGGFRAEGAPIRIGAAKIGQKVLTPKSMGVIGTFTKEILRRSTPNIETLVRAWMITDTAQVLDSVFLDAVAGTDIRPAGIRFGQDPLDTAVSTGNSPINIKDDVRGRLDRMTALKLGSRPVWLMNPSRLWGLAMSSTATGDKTFPEAAGPNPTLAGIPIRTSINVPADVVFLVDAAVVTFAGGVPTFEGTDVATLHEDSGMPLVDGVTANTVLPIATGTSGAGAITAAPVRSLFQTHSAAVKAVWEIDWAILRAGAVQTITGVAW